MLKRAWTVGSGVGGAGGVRGGSRSGAEAAAAVEGDGDVVEVRDDVGGNCNG